jgi:hypothetical protein
MNINCRNLTLVAIAAALAALVPVAGASAKTPTCKRAHSKTLQRNRVARVYTRNDKLFGCLRSKGRAIRLATAGGDGYVTDSAFGHVRLTRRFVGFTYTFTDNSCKADCPPGYDGVDDQVAIRDLRRKQTRRVHLHSAASAVFVGTKGGVAWTEGSGAKVTLGIRNRGGRRTITDVARNSVRRKGNQLIWSRFGHDEHASLGRY